MILTNAFSLNMVSQESGTIRFRRVTVEEARSLLASGFTSAVGHGDTANVLSDFLGIPVPTNRVTVSLAPGNTILVAQYRGPRLPEGATRLPEGAVIEFFLVTLE